MPRPRFLDERKQQDLCSLIHTGFTLAAAAKHIGCSALTIRREAQRNPQFDHRLRQAQYSQDANPVRTLRDAASHDWRAAAWLLERTQPENYARRAANSFSPHDVAELLDRVCEAIGAETNDPQISGRIRRRALAIANHKLVHQQQNLFRAQLTSPAPSDESEPSDDASPSNEHRDSSVEQPNSNPDGKKVVLIRASDCSRVEFPPVAAS